MNQISRTLEESVAQRKEKERKAKKERKEKLPD